LVRAWGFETDNPTVPAQTVIDDALASVGLDKLVIVDTEHVRKLVPELEIDMSSIGQGYAAERLAAVLEQNGITSYLAEIGGELVARGVKPNGDHWRIGVENPAPTGGPGPTLTLPESARVAVITSGTYRHYFDAAGRHFSHIIDPRTGRPIEHSLLAVTVLAENGARAAAWGTALLCLGPAPAAATAEREHIAALLWVGNSEDAAELQPSGTFRAEWPGVLEQFDTH
jgi:thiamine biosynthesis lipoprotein